MQDLDILSNSYLIIGGPKTKKSEVSLALSKELGYKLINLDREKHAYFDDFTDYDSSKYYSLLDKYGIEKAINYIHKYEMKHLDYVLNNIKQSVVIDFGNTYTLIDNNTLLNNIKLFKNIVLLYSNNIELNDFYKKLSKNRILDDIANIKINIENKKINDIIREILNYKEFKEIL